MDEKSYCCDCGAELPPGLPKGLCPRCALKGEHGLSPDQLFERRWAQTVMDRVLNRLREEYVAAGKADLFELLTTLQPEKYGEASYEEIAARLGVAKGTIASAVQRLRQRHREILREEIAKTVARPEDIDEEIRHLLAILSP
jgi:RNA polymerase sigma-70 factor (ECF subfamily)